MPSALRLRPEVGAPITAAVSAADRTPFKGLIELLEPFGRDVPLVATRAAPHPSGSIEADGRLGHGHNIA